MAVQLSTKQDIGIVLMLVMFVGTLYSYRQQCGNIAPAYDLSQLANVQIDTQSSTTQQLRDPQFWSTVDAEWSRDIVQFLPETVVGFMNSSESWTTWAQANIPNPPSWLTSGPVVYLNGQLAGLRTQSLCASDGSVGAVAIKQFAASIAGVTIAAIDFATLNSATVFLAYITSGNANQAFCASAPGQLG